MATLWLNPQNIIIVLIIRHPLHKIQTRYISFTHTGLKQTMICTYAVVEKMKERQYRDNIVETTQILFSVFTIYMVVMNQNNKGCNVFRS